MTDKNADREWLLQQARYMEQEMIQFYASLTEPERELLLEAMADMEDELWGPPPAAEPLPKVAVPLVDRG